MTEEETQKLLDEASGLYNDGRYDEAIAIWNGILEADPQNERAIEGIKMANLLTSDWEPTGESPEAGGAGKPLDPELLARVEAGVVRVDQLLAAGDLDAAREGVEALGEIAPDHLGVQACSARIEAAANPSEYVEEQLAMARHYLMLGESEEAKAIAHKVLAVDPVNPTATEIVGDIPASSGPAPVPAAMPPVAAMPLGLSLEPEAPVLDLPLDIAEPAPPAAPPMSAGDPRIAGLLAEGDALQAEGKHSEAIDAWSRVFIIEDSNHDAEERIDEARRALAARARLMEESLIRATDRETEGRLDEARDEALAVLAMSPGHVEAQGILEKIQARLDAGEEEIEAIPLEAMDEVPAEPEPPAPSPPPELPPFPVMDGEPGEAMTPKPPPKPPEREAISRPSAPKRSGMLIGLLAVVAVAVIGYGGWLAYQAFFPVVPRDDLSTRIPPRDEGGETGASTAPAPGGESPGGAVDGEIEEPVGESEGNPKPEPAQPSLSPEQARVRSAELVQSGIRGFEAGSFESALQQFEKAVSLDKANFEAQDWRDRAQAEVGKAAAFDQEMTLIQNLVDERDYRNALYKLYRVDPPDDPTRQKADAWISTAWHDWGVVLLQAGNPREAAEKLQEAVNARPDDTESAQHLDVAQRYIRRAVDDSFKAYASRLKVRGLP